MNPQNFFRTNKIIYFALLMGMLLFLAVSIFISKEDLVFYLDFSEPLFLVVPVLMFGCIAASTFIPKKLLAPIKNTKDLTQKTTVYNTSSIIKYALIEGPVLLSIVCFILTHSLYFLVFTAIGILYFVTLKPNPEKISRDLELTYDERSELGFK
ncbi:MAG: hypothetical protein ABJG68_11920 [Crocinitomicaceae bacterium]